MELNVRETAIVATLAGCGRYGQSLLFHSTRGMAGETWTMAVGSLNVGVPATVADRLAAGGYIEPDGEAIDGMQVWRATQAAETEFRARAAVLRSA